MRKIPRPISLATHAFVAYYSALWTKGEVSSLFDAEGRYLHGDINTDGTSSGPRGLAKTLIRNSRTRNVIAEVAS
jgi:hypothetical protein